MAYGSTEADLVASTTDQWIAANALDLFSSHNPLIAILRNKSQMPHRQYQFKQGGVLDGLKWKQPVYGKPLSTRVAGVTRANQINAETPALAAGLTTAYYEWAHYKTTAYYNYQDKAVNSGKEQMVDLGDTILNSVTADFFYKVGVDIWDGVVGTRDKLQSVQQCIANTGTVGGIDQTDSANNAWWQAQGDTTAATLSTFDLDKYRVRAMFDTGLPTGVRQPACDVLFLYDDLYASLLQQLKPAQRMEVADELAGGALYITYSGMRCYRNTQMTANTVVGLNSATWVVRYNTEAPEPVTPGWVPVSDTPAMFQKGYNWMLGFGCISPKHNFYLTNRTA